MHRSRRLRCRLCPSDWSRERQGNAKRCFPHGFPLVVSSNKRAHAAGNAKGALSYKGIEIWGNWRLYPFSVIKPGRSTGAR